MTTITLSIMIIAVIAVVITLLIHIWKVIKAATRGNHKEFMCLTTPYDVAELMAMKDFGTTSEEFEQAWKEVLKVLGGLATPYDAYLLCEQKMLAEEVTTEEDNL